MDKAIGKAELTVKVGQLATIKELILGSASLVRLCFSNISLRKSVYFSQCFDAIFDRRDNFDLHYLSAGQLALGKLAGKVTKFYILCRI